MNSNKVLNDKMDESKLTPLVNATSFMFDKLMPLTQAVEAYDLFDKMQVQKVIFKPNE